MDKPDPHDAIERASALRKRLAEERARRVAEKLPAQSRDPSTLPLAHGILSENDASELHALKALIEANVGLNCEGYKEKCLRRRIAVRMRARGLHTYGSYAELLATDAGEYQLLLDAVTINVSKFFRNIEVWHSIRDMVIPWLFERDEPEIHLWSAGCAGGEEPYTLAMMILEHAARRGEDPARFIIHATDVDKGALAIARRGEYGPFAMTETPDEMRNQYFEAVGGLWRVRDEVRALVRFAELDLIKAEYPQNLHLILCRNVIIYFERVVQEDLFRRFNSALVPGGFLVLGKVEALFGTSAVGYRTLSSRERIFRRA